MALTVGSLFSGIGGIDLGLERAGMVTRWFVEIDPHCRNVLARHWPGLPIYGDITAIDWSGVEPVDVLAGGFPCQPNSVAGQRLGTSDPRWLWPEFARAIRALRPRYVLVENVPNLLRVNDGAAMAEVLGDLAASGYDAEWDCIPAEVAGAPHQRDRLWLVAYADGGGLRAGIGSLPTRQPDTTRSGSPVPDDGGRRCDLPRRRGQHGTGATGTDTPGRGDAVALAHADRSRLAEFPWSVAHAGLRRLGASGGDGWWESEPALGRVVDGLPHRVDQLRSLGNAVVPQVVEPIGLAIVAFDEGRIAA